MTTKILRHFVLAGLLSMPLGQVAAYRTWYLYNEQLVIYPRSNGIDRFSTALSLRDRPRCK